MSVSLNLLILLLCNFVTRSFTLAWVSKQKHGSLLSSCHRTQLLSSQADDGSKSSDKLKVLLEAAGLERTDVAIESIKGEAAFCNTLYRIRYKNTTAIAKIFSLLATERMDPTRSVGELDHLAANHGLAPSILTATDTGILMEECHGRILSEADMHGEDSTICCQVAEALAHLHQINASTNDIHRPNMLWRACEIMLSVTKPSYHLGDWGIARLRRAVEEHKRQLETLKLPTVTFGHGDCKPSNAILTDDGIKFIDLELAGKHYQGFDLAKLWRTDLASQFTERNRRLFFETYINSLSGGAVAVEELQREAELLLPLTWLEAAIFFVYMADHDFANKTKWRELALDRFRHYNTP